jgi:hypothetical protein
MRKNISDRKLTSLAGIWFICASQADRFLVEAKRRVGGNLRGYSHAG